MARTTGVPNPQAVLCFNQQHSGSEIVAEEPMEAQQATVSALLALICAKLEQLLGSQASTSRDNGQDRLRLQDHLRQVVAEHREAIVQAVLAESLAHGIRPDSALSYRKKRLKMFHCCEGQGCSEASCNLCKNNPYKVCRSDMRDKYLVADALTAKCGAPLQIKVVDTETDKPVIAGNDGLKLQMFLVNGNSVAGTLEHTFDFEPSALYLNQKGCPLLLPGAEGTHDDEFRVSTQAKVDGTFLPNLQVTDSSEALLAGRKAAFRLVVRALNSDGSLADIQPLLSEPFVVATRRTKGNLKEEFPMIRDPVSKLEAVGKQTADKLLDLLTAAETCKEKVDLHLPWEYTTSPGGRLSIENVGQLRKLMLDAEQDKAGLKKKLMKVLKMSKDLWDRTFERVLGAVDVDDRLRKWYVNSGSRDQGIVYHCKQAKIDFRRPVGLMQRVGGVEHVVSMEDLSSSQRQQLAELQPKAMHAWRQPRHPGWEACDADFKSFQQTHNLSSQPAGITGLVAEAPVTASGDEYDEILCGLEEASSPSSSNSNHTTSPGEASHSSRAPAPPNVDMMTGALQQEPHDAGESAQQLPAQGMADDVFASLDDFGGLSWPPASMLRDSSGPFNMDPLSDIEPLTFDSADWAALLQQQGSFPRAVSAVDAVARMPLQEIKPISFSDLPSALSLSPTKQTQEIKDFTSLLNLVLQSENTEAGAMIPAVTNGNDGGAEEGAPRGQQLTVQFGDARSDGLLVTDLPAIVNRKRSAADELAAGSNKKEKAEC